MLWGLGSVILDFWQIQVPIQIYKYRERLYINTCIYIYVYHVYIYIDHCKLKTVYCSIYIYTSQASLVQIVSLTDIPDTLLDLQNLNPHLLWAIQMDSLRVVFFGHFPPTISPISGCNIIVHSPLCFCCIYSSLRTNFTDLDCRCNWNEGCVYLIYQFVCSGLQNGLSLNEA